MSTATEKTGFLTVHRPEGDVAYEVSGSGPLIVCTPGMGDLRTSYRFLAPALVAAGFRVAVMDLRGHGDSAVTFSEYGDRPTAGDIEALIAELGGPATRHDIAERALAVITAPSLIVMGQQDPDFSDPAVEASWIAHELVAEVVMVPEAGHYPQSQRPDVVGPAVIQFARQISA
jgi:pimeloyl-ACP methyl ester carboxylesterase